MNQVNYHWRKSETLPIPIVCECGYSTMDAPAIRHIKEKHPELWRELQQDVLREMWTEVYKNLDNV